MRLLWLGLLIMCGCAHVPDHDLSTVATSSECDTVVADALNSGNFTTGEWPNEAWWKEFNDPILTNLIEGALKSSPTLLRAEARLKAAAQVAKQRKARLWPEVNFNADSNWEYLAKDGLFRAFAPVFPANIDDVNIDLNFYYEFDFWGKNRDLFKAALGQAKAAAAEKKQAELILTTSIAYTYAELQFLFYKRQIFEQTEKNRRSITSTRTKLQKYALDTDLSRLTAHTDTLDTQALIADLDQTILEHIHKIKALSGLGQDADIALIPRTLDPLTFSLPERLSLDLIARRPDLVAQKERVEAAAKEISAAKTDFYPNFDLKAFIGFESLFWHTLFTNKNHSSSIDPAIHLPIFTAGRLRAQLWEKVGNFNEAVSAYNELILQAAQEVADRLTNISLIQKQIEIRKMSLQAVEKREDLTARRFEHALDDRITLINAKNAVLDSKLTLAWLEYSKQLAGILLIRSLGGGYHE